MKSPEAPHIAASFTLSLLHTLGLTSIAPLYDKEDGLFERYDVQPRITYADLKQDDRLQPGDRVYMVKEFQAIEELPQKTSQVIVRKNNGVHKLQPILEYLVEPAGELAYAVYQYEEMEAIGKGEIVAVAIPSGVAFKANRPFSGIFLSKPAALYDKDPNVGPWPVGAENIGNVKFCYPCKVSKMAVKF